MAEPDWYESYFDARVLRLYRARLNPAEDRSEVAAIIELLGLPLGSRLLDVGCGWGRHALLLAEAGYRVTGVDVSEEALAEAARSAGEAGLDVRWIRRDMRELGFGPSFDAALSLFSSLGFFLSDEEDARVLLGIRGALRPEGMLLLETMHRDSFLEGFRERERWDDVEDGPVEVERSFDAVRGVNRERLVWPDGAVKEHAMRIRTVTEWKSLVEAAGFRAEGLYADWEGEPVRHTSARLVVVGRRQG